MQDIKQNLADAIRKSRTELGLSQEKLAEILGFVIIPELSEPPVRTLGATIPENESHIFR